jgi:hypothetical protein
MDTTTSLTTKPIGTGTTTSLTTKPIGTTTSLTTKPIGTGTTTSLTTKPIGTGTTTSLTTKPIGNATSAPSQYKILVDLLNNNNMITQPSDTDEITVNNISILIMPNIDKNISNLSIQSLYTNNIIYYNYETKQYEIATPLSKITKNNKKPTWKHVVDVLNYYIYIEPPVFNRIVFKGVILEENDSDIIPNISNEEIQDGFDKGFIKYNEKTNDYYAS